jgi:hypothetical protein
VLFVANGKIDGWSCDFIGLFCVVETVMALCCLYGYFGWRVSLCLALFSASSQLW